MYKIKTELMRQICTSSFFEEGEASGNSPIPVEKGGGCKKHLNEGFLKNLLELIHCNVS